MAIDYGKKVTGLATFTVDRDPFPLPFGRIIYENDQQIVDEITKIIESEVIEVLILGLPLFTDGTESEMTKIVRGFGSILKKKISIPLYYQDETLTTFEAKERMKNSPRYNFKINLKEIDALAASIILEDFIKQENQGINLE
jgi:putative Holliday junction resolvase